MNICSRVPYGSNKIHEFFPTSIVGFRAHHPNLPREWKHIEQVDSKWRRSIGNRLMHGLTSYEAELKWPKASMVPFRILLVDDHAVARKSIRSVLTKDPSLTIVSEATDGEEAVKRSEELHPDVILLDISLPGISGTDAARLIRVVSPESRIIFVSQHDSIQIAKDALSVGAQGYVVKSDAGRDLLTAIQSVLEGKTFVSRTLTAKGWI